MTALAGLIDRAKAHAGPGRVDQKTGRFSAFSRDFNLAGKGTTMAEMIGPRLSDADFFGKLGTSGSIDTTRPGLEGIPEAVAHGDFATARRLFAAEVRRTLQPERFFRIQREFRGAHFMKEGETPEQAGERILSGELISCSTPHQFEGRWIGSSTPPSTSTRNGRGNSAAIPSGASWPSATARPATSASPRRSSATSRAGCIRRSCRRTPTAAQPSAGAPSRPASAWAACGSGRCTASTARRISPTTC